MEISCKKYEKKLKILTLKDTFGRENLIEVPFCFISILIFQVNFLIFKTRLWMNDHVASIFFLKLFLKNFVWYLCEFGNDEAGNK